MQHFQPGDVVEFTMALNKEGHPQALELALPAQIGHPAVGKSARQQAFVQPTQQHNGEADQRYVGTIKSFFVDKGFGFIECPELFEVYGRDTWLHHVQIQHFQPGQVVEFTMALNKEGHPQALELALPAQRGKPAKRKSFSNIQQFEALQAIQQHSVEADQRFAGTIKSFFAEKGFGFIDCPDLFEFYGRDTWLHHAQVQHFQPGDVVEFTMALNKEGHPQALDLAPPAQMGTPAKGKSSGGKAAARVSPTGAQPSQGYAAFAGKGAQPSQGKKHVQTNKASEPGVAETPHWLQAADDERYSGVVKSFAVEKGFGFIDCPALKEVYGRDTWAHAAQLGSFQVGDSVVFSMTLNQQGHPQGIDLGAADTDLV